MKHPTQQAPHSEFSVSASKPGYVSAETQLENGTQSHVPADSGEDLVHRLILTLEGKIIREYPIEKYSLSIGRRHGNDIQLNDLSLSGRHARITWVPDHVFVEDLDSTNGTLVNG
ncbi:FHA domain-containing protein, partial [Kaarinaea lacus]